MRLHRPAAAFAFLLALFPPGAAGAEEACGCAKALDARRLAAHVRALASPDLEGRAAGTPGGEMARAYLVTRLRSLGLEPGFEGRYARPFVVRDRRLANVAARVPGRDPALSEETIVLGAHYDHLGRRGETIFPGADDNASGCAALLEIARSLARDPPRRSVLIVFFDGEEIGLLGSRRFVREPPLPRERIVCMVNLDMLSRGDPREVRVCGMPTSALFAPIVRSAAAAHGLRVFDDHELEWRDASDHAPFGDARIPFLYFGVLDHPDYHRPTDTAERIDTAKLRRVASLVLHVVRRLAETEDRPVFARDPGG